jgi:hypothetical protein
MLITNMDENKPKQGIALGIFCGGKISLLALAIFFAIYASNGENLSFIASLTPCASRVEMTLFRKGSPAVRRHSNKDDVKMNAATSRMMRGYDIFLGNSIASMIGRWSDEDVSLFFVLN